MVPQESVLVMVIRLVENIPLPPPPQKGSWGHPRVYLDRLLLKALVLMIVRPLVSAHELLSVLVEPTPEMQTPRALLTEQARYPCRRTFE
jgi:hypothetical protein